MKFKLKTHGWSILALVVIGGLAFWAIHLRRTQPPKPEEMSLSALAAEIRAGRVAALEVSNTALLATRADGTQLTARKEPAATLDQTLSGVGLAPQEMRGVEVSIESPSLDGRTMLAYLLPLAIGIGVLMLMLRQMQGSHSSARLFGASRARLQDTQFPRVRFSDVAGAEEAKQELVEVVEFLREPEKFLRLGARIPKGVLLAGSPGTGKTLLAKAVSGEAGVPFLSISGSEFVEMFVGVGASRVRDLFARARRNSPCIVFVDEIDAVGRQRGAGVGGGHDEREQTLNQILVEMDGFNTDGNVIVMAATNRPDILDPALLRPGRFDRRVILDRPDVKGREAIFAVHTAGKPLADDVDLAALARATPGLVGADIQNIVNEAAILAARGDKRAIEMADFQEAVERTRAGPERKSRLISQAERRVIAYHEAGHAVAMYFTPGCDPVHKVSIIARGMMGGYTLSLPEPDRMLHTRGKFKADLVALLGGRVAEEMVFDDITTGAVNDLERATALARAMVTRYGMSEKLGPMVFGKKDEPVFLGRELGEQRDYSDSVAETIDAEVRALVAEAHDRARATLTENLAALERAAAALLEQETIVGAQLAALCAG